MRENTYHKRIEAIRKAANKPRKGDDTRGVRNFIAQEKEDFVTSKGVKGKARSVVESIGQAISLPGRKTKKVAEATGRAAARGVKKASRSLRASSQKMLDAEEARNKKLIEKNYGSVEEYMKMKNGSTMKRGIKKGYRVKK